MLWRRSREQILKGQVILETFWVFVSSSLLGYQNKKQLRKKKKYGKALNKDRQIAVICNVLLTCRIYYCKMIAQ